MILQVGDHCNNLSDALIKIGTLKDSRPCSTSPWIAGNSSLRSLLISGNREPTPTYPLEQSQECEIFREISAVQHHPYLFREIFSYHRFEDK